MITIVLLFVAVLLCIPCACFLLQVVAGILPGSRRVPVRTTSPALAVLVPAHDEANGIAATLATILPQLAATDRCLVVADNCSDDTARIARALGAEVVERADTARRGKGYALDFGLAALAAHPPDVVVMVDADCRVGPGAIATLAARCAVEQRPMQALYLMQGGPDDSRGRRIAEFAWLVKNHARPLGLERLGLPCQLMGSGMAFPWSQLARVDLASGHIVEDMKLGIDLASAGHLARFCPDARVTSAFPAAGAATRAQRTRWEHGHLGIIVSEVPRMLARAVIRRDPRLVALALDLAIPPLALLLMAVVAFIVVAAIAATLTGALAPLLFGLLDLTLVASAVVAAWWRFGRAVLPFSTLALAPWYAVRKLPIYLRFLVKRQSEWVRSKRDTT